MYTNEITNLLVNEWYLLLAGMFFYWVVNTAILTVLDTLCKKKIQNFPAAKAVSLGLTPFVVICSGSIMQFAPVLNKWHLGINILLSVVSIVWMVIAYCLFNTIRKTRMHILMGAPYNGWYLTRQGKAYMSLVMVFLTSCIIVKTLSYRLGFGSKVSNFKSIRMNVDAIAMVHFNGPLPKWFIDLVNFTLDCFTMDNECRIDYRQTIGKQLSKEDIVKIHLYIKGLGLV